MALKKDKPDSEEVVEESEEVVVDSEEVPDEEDPKEETAINEPAKVAEKKSAKKAAKKSAKAKKGSILMNVKKFTIYCEETGVVFRPDVPVPIERATKFMQDQIDDGIMVIR